MASAPLYLTILRQGDTITTDLAAIDPVVPRSQLQVEESLLLEIGEELARLTALANRSAAPERSVPLHRCHPRLPRRRPRHRLVPAQRPAGAAAGRGVWPLLQASAWSWQGSWLSSGSVKQRMPGRPGP